MGARERKVCYFRSYTEIPNKLKNEVVKVLEESGGEYLQKFWGQEELTKHKIKNEKKWS